MDGEICIENKGFRGPETPLVKRDKLEYTCGNMDKYYLTKERAEELRAELETLKTKKRFEIADLLKQAKEYGDLSENSEYSEARDEQSRVEARIFELEEMLRKVVIIEKSGSTDEVGIGSSVTVMLGSRIVEYKIVGSNEAKPEAGTISNESPLGRALLHHKAGDSVSITTPGGQATYHITKIE